MNDTADTAEYLRELKRLMEEDIPFNVFLGLQCERLEAGTVTLRMPFRKELIGDPYRPALHGGTLSALADTAGGAAVFSAVEQGARVSTIDLRIDYLRPGRLEDVWADAQVIRQGNRVGVTRIVVWQRPRPGKDEERSVIAEATGVYSVRLSEPR
jgi:uncharacterized protein (TIGR00369 family)